MRNNGTRWLTAGVAGVALMILGSTAAVAPSFAGTDVDLRAAMYPDADALAIGGGLLTDIGHANWFFNPNVEVAMGDNHDLMILSGDFHYDFGASSSLSLWAGGGPALLVDNPSRGDTSTDVGLNALFGVGSRAGGVRPFGQIRGTIADHSQLALEGGIRF